MSSGAVILSPGLNDGSCSTIEDGIAGRVGGGNACIGGRLDRRLLDLADSQAVCRANANMVLEFFRVSQSNPDSDRHEPALFGVEDVTRADLARNKLHRHRGHGRSDVAPSGSCAARLVTRRPACSRAAIAQAWVGSDQNTYEVSPLLVPLAMAAASVLIAVGEDALHRPEDLLSSDGHLIGDIGEQRGPDEMSPEPIEMALAAGGQCRARRIALDIGIHGHWCAP